MSRLSINDFASFLPDYVAASFGELFFVERFYSSCSSMWIPCIGVAADSVPTARMKNICMNFYRNVSFIILYNYIVDSPLMVE